jgi:uncharacterized protein (DUF1330 family)
MPAILNQRSGRVVAEARGAGGARRRPRVWHHARPDQRQGHRAVTAYLIADVDIRDPAAYDDYKANVPALIRRHGGDYLVRGGAHQVIEGDWRPVRLVLLRFPDAAAARAFLDDPDYRPLAALRHRVAATDMVLVDGL